MFSMLYANRIHIAVHISLSRLLAN